MVRAWVALAWGLEAVAAFSSTSSRATPRRPSALASIRPHGPPPTTRTGIRTSSVTLTLPPRRSPGRDYGEERARRIGGGGGPGACVRPRGRGARNPADEPWTCAQGPPAPQLPD